MRRRDFISSVCAVPLMGAEMTRAQSSAKIIDVHAHCALGELTTYMKKLGTELIPQRLIPASLPITDSEAHMKARLKMMDEAGVGLQILSPPPVPYITDQAAALGLARLINDGHEKITRNYAGRMTAYVYLPLPHVDAALAEMKRGLDELGMAGVNMFNAIDTHSIVDPQYDPLYEEMNRRGAVLFIHPSLNGLCSPLIKDYGLSGSIGPTMEDTAVAAHLITHGIPARFPKIKIIVPHLGGSLPLLLQRMDNQVAHENPRLTERPSTTARRLWYDTVSHGSAPALRCACETLGAGRLLAGSDYPALLPFETYQQTIHHVRQADLAADAVDLILHQNAAVLFPELARIANRESARL